MEKNHNNILPIGVFDSGIGGLSVLKQLVRFLPQENYIYLGDTARVPYGNKSPEIVRQYAAECTDFLVSKQVKLVIAACNTVSSVALDVVSNHAGNIPVISMIEPASSAALRESSNARIGIIGTRATISSKAYENEITKLSGNKNLKVFSKPCPLFVPIVEEGMMKHPSTKLIAIDYLRDMIDAHVDTLVLGCTHYPLLSQLLQEIMPEVTLIDSGEHASVTALRILAEARQLQEQRKEFIEKPNVKFYVTDLPVNFAEQANMFLGFESEKPELISL
ncbi:MAG: glutamate racemase [Desulfobulbaceae bacterium]|nr:glutamate racemase [Candidatus Kapabacteria bacterium]MBS4000194.1 glutamate racemase [Desulfobulbaceae bacterium]